MLQVQHHNVISIYRQKLQSVLDLTRGGLAITSQAQWRVAAGLQFSSIVLRGLNFRGFG